MIATLHNVTLGNARHWDCPVAPSHLQNILDGACRDGIRQVWLLDGAGRPWIQSARIHEEGAATACVPVVVQGVVVATIQVMGEGADDRSPEEAARDVAARLTDAWQAAREIDSLAAEIVHAYEELHLLYELGDALAGQLTVAQAADMILAKTLDALHARWAKLRLEATGDCFVRHGQEAGSPGRQREGEAQQLQTVLRNGGQLLGSIVLMRSSSAAPFSSADNKLLDAVGAFAGTAIRNAQLYEELRRQADTDALTGLLNHRAVQERLDTVLATATAQSEPLGVMMIDIDDFKLFNDTYGHLVGDQILRLTAATLRDACRAGDIVGRYGGDEFIMLLPRADRASASQIARRILDTMARQGVRIPGQETLPIALSLGFALFPDDAALKNDLLGHADAALYETKRCGGNGVRLMPETDEDDALLAGAGTTFSALQGLVNAVDSKDRYTREHSDTVAEAALLLAKQLGLSAETCGALRIAGLLHDVDKIGVPDRLLRKPGRLNEDEYKIMQQHVALSELIIKEVPHLVDVLSAVSNHHERYDGGGYPRGLRGEDIPLLGRIMAIADACSAMLLDRPYRKGMRWPETVAALRAGSGAQFDPALVEPFISAIERSSFLRKLGQSPRD